MPLRSDGLWISGIRYVGSTLVDLNRRNKHRAVVAVCTAGGTATAAYLERLWAVGRPSISDFADHSAASKHLRTADEERTGRMQPTTRVCGEQHLDDAPGAGERREWAANEVLDVAL